MLFLHVAIEDKTCDSVALALQITSLRSYCVFSVCFAVEMAMLLAPSAALGRTSEVARPAGFAGRTVLPSAVRTLSSQSATRRGPTACSSNLASDPAIMECAGRGTVHLHQ